MSRPCRIPEGRTPCRGSVFRVPRAAYRIRIPRSTLRAVSRAAPSAWTTPSAVFSARLLKATMNKWLEANPNSHFVLGRVRYMSGGEIGQWLANTLNSSIGPDFFRTIQGRAESLLLKRSYFSHEDEVRLICLQREKVADPGDFRSFAFDPNELFTEISFDPRLISFERIEREAEIRRLGFTGVVKEDRSYGGVFNQVMMTRNWPDP